MALIHRLNLVLYRLFTADMRREIQILLKDSSTAYIVKKRCFFNEIIYLICRYFPPSKCAESYLSIGAPKLGTQKGFSDLRFIIGCLNRMAALSINFVKNLVAQKGAV